MLYIVVYGQGKECKSQLENDLNDVRRLTHSLVQRGYSIEEINIFEVEKQLLAKIEFVEQIQPL